MIKVEDVALVVLSILGLIILAMPVVTLYLNLR